MADSFSLHSRSPIRHKETPQSSSQAGLILCRNLCASDSDSNTLITINSTSLTPRHHKVNIARPLSDLFKSKLYSYNFLSPRKPLTFSTEFTSINVTHHVHNVPSLLSPSVLPQNPLPPLRSPALYQLQHHPNHPPNMVHLHARHP